MVGSGGMLDPPGRTLGGGQEQPDPGKPGQKDQDRQTGSRNRQQRSHSSSTPRPASRGGGSLRAFRRAGLFRDDWYHFLLVQLSIHCGSQSPRSIPRSRPKIPKNRPKMGPDGTKMGPKPSEKAPGGAPKTKKTTKEARWDKRHSNLNVPEPLGPYFGGPRAAKRGPRPSQERPKRCPERSKSGFQKRCHFSIVFSTFLGRFSSYVFDVF